MIWAILLSILVGIFFFLWLVTRLTVRRAESKYPPRGKFLSVGRHRLHYVEKGSGQPVVLLHGDSGSTYDFLISPLFEQLARNFRVLAFDRPGLGYSQRPNDGASPFVQAQMIHAALKALNLEKPVLVGHSRSGPVVLAYALEYPDDLAGVVNVSGGSYYLDSGFSIFNLLAMPLLGPLLAHTVGVPFGHNVVRQTMELAFSPDRRPPKDFLEAFSTMELRPGQLLASADDIVNSVDGMRRLVARYREFCVPVISVHGAADRNVHVSASERLQQEIPGSGLIVIPDTGHEVMVNHPEAIEAGIRWVLAQHRDSRQEMGGDETFSPNISVG